MSYFLFLISKFRDDLELRVKEKPLGGLVIFLLVIIFGIPLIEYLHGQVKRIHYLELFLTLIAIYKTTFSLADSIIIFVFFILLIICLRNLADLKKSKQINDNFKSELTKWSIPIGSSWNTTAASGGPGKMLVVTDSDLPGLLKGAFSWYDYEFTFKAKIHKDAKSKNLGIFLRAKDSMNGLFLKVGEKNISLYYIFDDYDILDDSQSFLFTTPLPVDSWINCLITVKGNKIFSKFEGQEFYFSILDYKFSWIPKNVLWDDPQISKLKEITKNNNKLFNNYFSTMGSLNKMKESVNSEADLEQAKREFNNAKVAFNNATANSDPVNLEYKSGSVGFRQEDDEIANFRDVIVRRLD